MEAQSPGRVKLSELRGAGQPGDVAHSLALEEPASGEKPHPTCGVSNVSAGRNMHLAGEAVVVGLRVGAEVAADAE
ncbi:MAG: hypothetical protein M3518_08930 [Actinomycetota bacterium]|nr:hypothetical protein [Actinomycetota bacterium]